MIVGTPGTPESSTHVYSLLVKYSGNNIQVCNYTYCYNIMMGKLGIQQIKILRPGYQTLMPNNGLVRTIIQLRRYMWTIMEEIYQSH